MGKAARSRVDMSTLTPPTPAQLGRLGEALSESWRVVAKHDPEFAYTQKFVAEALRDGRFLGAFLMCATKPPPGKAPRLSVHRQSEIARDWWLAREEALPPGQTPPSAAQDHRDARQEIPGVSRQTIRKFRPPIWDTSPKT
jgi:hypothetical protein